MSTPNHLNSGIKSWARDVADIMRSNVSMMTNNSKHVYLRTSLKTKKTYGYKKRLTESILTKYNLNFGEIDRIMFPMNRYGVFLARGSGRGHNYKTNPRPIVDWYNTLLNDTLPSLAELVGEYYADKAVIKASNFQGVKIK